MTVIISGDDGVSDVDGSAGTPAIRGTDANTGIFFGADQVGVATNGVERVEFGNSETVFNDSGASVDFRVEGDTNANLLFVDASADKVGIGTNAPIALLSIVDSATSTGMEIQPEITTNTNRITNYDRVESAYKIFRLDASEQHFYISGTERMRIDSSGNLLVGKTSQTGTGVGIELQEDGTFYVGKTGDVATFNRTTSVDGTLIEFQEQGSTVGRIENRSSTINLITCPITSGVTVGAGIGGTDGAVLPCNASGIADNAVDLGTPTFRWDDIYATNGTIQTSDANEKQDIEALSEAEQRVAVAAKGLLRKYRWKDKVAEKGDDARIHFGIIAQDLKAAFEAEGLDAGRYAMFIHSAWWEHQVEVPAVEADEENGIEAKEAYTRIDTYQTEAEAPEGAVRKERMGVRYNELLAFMVAAL